MTTFRFTSRLLPKLGACLLLGAMTYAAADSTAKNDAQNAPAVDSGLAFAGMPAEIVGNNLSGVTKVVFSGKFPAQFKILSDQKIEVIVPEEAMTGPVELYTSTGEVMTNLVFVVDNSGA